MKKIYKFFAAILCVGILGVQGLAIRTAYSLPENFYVTRGESLVFDEDYKITAVSGDMNSVLGEPRLVGFSEDRNYKTTLKLFGVINIKEVSVNVVDRELVVPGGTPFGIKMFTEGVYVVGLSDINVSGRLVNPAKEAGIKVGDVILAIDGKQVALNEDIAALVASGGGKSMSFKIKRKDTIMYLTLNPVKSDVDLAFKAGIWVRDSSAGIGTMTYYNPETLVFAGLGHAVCDINTGEILPLSKGEIVDVMITGVNKGQSGSPGELKGSFVNETSRGYLIINSETGVFGRLKGPVSGSSAIPLALKQEVKCGEAQIFTTISGNRPQKYDIIIEKVNIADQSQTKNMVIRITDPELLSLTGGIVQGMSGSPIIQNGKLVGAVTHVFVNDLCRGYGVFAENMELTAQNVVS